MPEPKPKKPPGRKPSANAPRRAPEAPAEERVDEREQTFNDGASGPVECVSTPADLITSVDMIMDDIDPKFLRPDLYAGTDGTVAERLYANTVRGWLDRHPLMKSAEVRATGTGLHVLLRLDPPVVFDCTNDRDRWGAMIRIVQSTLPCDPNAPGLIALTRPIGSINGKSGLAVKVLRPGTPVHPDTVLKFVADVQAKPFSVLARVLHGPGTIRPCPVCRADGSALAALDRAGRCYGCGSVTVAQLFATVMVDPPAETEGK